MVPVLKTVHWMFPRGTIVLALLLGACGGGDDGGSGGSGGGPSGPAPVVLQSIAVTPDPFTTGVGITRRLTATGTYSDGTTAVLGSNATWSSQTPAIATVSDGAVTGVSLGAASISVSSGGVSTTVALNVTSNAWSPAPTMARSPYGLSGVVLPSGKVFAAGGDGLAAYAEIFDPVAETWTNVNTRLNTAGHILTLLASGKVLIVGGATHTAYVASSVTYDPVADSWSAGTRTLSGRDGHTATPLPDGTVLVAGGEVFPKPAVSSEERYNPVTDSWSAVPLMGTARRWHEAILLNNGKVLVSGGYGNTGGNVGGPTLASAEIYDPVANSWMPAASMAAARYYHTMTLLPDGTVLVVGGQTTTGNTNTPLASAERYDPVTDTWSSAGTLTTARYGHGAILLPNGKVLVIGGLTGQQGGQLTSTELYDSATNTWSAGPSIAVPGGGGNAVLLQNGVVFVCSGGSPNRATCQYYW